MYPYLSQSSSLTFIITLVILYNINQCSSSRHHIDQRYESCTTNSSNCGTSIRIAYPFREKDRPEYCGHPGFELSCDGNNNVWIEIMSKAYKVIDINYNTSVLTIVHDEFLYGECPKREQLHNTSLDYNLFRFTSNVRNATLFYSCPSSRVDSTAPFHFFCPQVFQNSLSYLVITQDWENELDKKCGVKVYMPVFNATIQELIQDYLSVGDVMKRGFQLKWVIDQGHCQECYISGGCCGYNSTLSQSTCFCEQGAYSTACPAPKSSKGLKTEAKAGIGVGVAATVLFILITLFVYLRPHEEPYTSSSYPSQNPSNLATPEQNSTYFGAHLFSYKELEQATNYFSPSKELGKGGFGTVYHGKLKDGRDVAIKRLFEKHNRQVAQFMNELEILALLNHKHLVKLHGCTRRRSRQLLLVYEYVPNGTIAEHLNGKLAKPNSLPWPIRLRIAAETASALVYLHASDIIHRDVKTRNILLDANFSVKVADFGLSRLFPLDVTHVSTTPQGSPGYVDPEYYQCYQLTDKSDVFSFGVVLAELLSGKPAVDRSRSKEEINLSGLFISRIQKKLLSDFVDPSLGFGTNPRVTEEVTEVAEITFRCLQPTREMRPSMEEVLTSLTSIQREDTSEAEVMDVPKEVTVVYNGCDSLPSSNGAEETGRNHSKDSIALSFGEHNAHDSINVHVSSDVV